MRAAPITPSILGHVAKEGPKGCIYAEKKTAMLLATSNIPFTFADVFNTSMKDMFPDSEIARQYANGRTMALEY